MTLGGPGGVDLHTGWNDLKDSRNFWVGAFWCLVVFLCIFSGGNV